MLTVVPAYTACVLTCAQTHKTVWLHPSGNVQYTLEGYYVALLNALAAACIIAVIVLAPKLKSATLKNAIMASSALSFWFLFTRIVLTYKAKNPWYLR